MIDDEGLPKLGRSARMLGIRLGVHGDIEVGDDGRVHPQTGGMSVTPDDPYRMDFARRPRALGGRSNDPVWALDAALLPATLLYRTDAPERHGLIEPAHVMRLADYEAALAATRPLWMQVFALSLEMKRC